ncbi:MAG TPA: hypothetical protein DCR93_21420, partial [Cytophagales bacterium]|nr:hypothetical protein [Cytophagales bacterium]
MRTLQVFLASSEELAPERQFLERQIAAKNDVLVGQGQYIRLIFWEKESAVMSQTRSQDEYNKKVEGADLLVLLAWTKVGKFTEEEFDAALAGFHAKGTPKILTYFFSKDLPNTEEAIREANKRLDFQTRLDALGHFWAQYDGPHHLWTQLNQELDRLLDDSPKPTPYPQEAPPSVTQEKPKAAEATTQQLTAEMPSRPAP